VVVWKFEIGLLNGDKSDLRAAAVKTCQVVRGLKGCKMQKRKFVPMIILEKTKTESKRRKMKKRDSGEVV